MSLSPGPCHEYSAESAFDVGYRARVASDPRTTQATSSPGLHNLRQSRRTMVSEATVLFRLEGYGLGSDEPMSFNGVSFFPDGCSEEDIRKALGLTPEDKVLDGGPDPGAGGAIVSFRIPCGSDKDAKEKAGRLFGILQSIALFGRLEWRLAALNRDGASDLPTLATDTTDLNHILREYMPEALLPILVSEPPVKERDSSLRYRLLSAVDAFMKTSVLGVTPSSFCLMRSVAESLVSDNHVCAGPDFIAMGYAMAGVYEDPEQALAKEKEYQRKRDELATGSCIEVDKESYDDCFWNLFGFVTFLGKLIHENGDHTMSQLLSLINDWVEKKGIVKGRKEVSRTSGGDCKKDHTSHLSKHIGLYEWRKVILVVLFLSSAALCIFARLNMSLAAVLSSAIVSVLALMLSRVYWASNYPLEFDELPWTTRIQAAEGRDTPVGRNILRYIDYELSRYNVRLTVISVLISMEIAVMTISAPWEDLDAGSFAVLILLGASLIISIQSVFSVDKDEIVQMGHKTKSILKFGYGVRYGNLTDDRVETLFDELNQLKSWVNRLSVSIQSSLLVLALVVLVSILSML